MVHMLVYLYNCTRRSATGFSSYYLMNGQKPDSQLICTLLPKIQMWMLSHVLNLYNNYAKDLNGLIKQPSMSLKKKTRDISQTMIRKSDAPNEEKVTRLFSRGQPLKADIRSRTIWKILYIMLRGNNMLACHFSRLPQLQGKVRWK